MVRSRFNAYAYLSFFFVAVFLILSLYLLLHPQLNLKGKTGKTFPAPLVGFVILLLTFFLFYVLAKVIYFITIDNSISIKGVFRKKQIERSEIKSIDLFSREDFYWSTGSVTIGTRIELENGEKFIIADPFYRNIDIIKQTLSEGFKEKIKPYNTNKSARLTQTVFDDDLEKFAGNSYTSFNGLLFLGFILFFVLMILYKQNLQVAHLFLILPVIILYFGFGSQLNYFLISKNRLIVKNHLLFWVNKVYYIDDITHVNFESPYRRSEALRITTSNFKSRLYSAGSLRRKDWRALKEKLTSLQIHFV